MVLRDPIGEAVRLIPPYDFRVVHRSVRCRGSLFQAFSVTLSKFLHFWRDNRKAITRVGILFIIILVIFLGLIEILEAADFRNDWIPERAFGHQLFDPAAAADSCPGP